MNQRFHAILLNEARSAMLADALDRVSRVSFAGPQALAFDEKSDADVFDKLFYAHRQHHSIVDAIEAGQAARVEALMREHANAAKDSLNVAELRVGAPVPSDRVAMLR
jgi:GntR family transcriptional regulator, vanillate catabolism transcriptional regulator